MCLFYPETRKSNREKEKELQKLMTEQWDKLYQERKAKDPGYRYGKR
jgi:hypothetical protein